MKEKGLQNDNPLWLEIKQWRDNYINIVDILQSKHLLSEELSKVLEKNETFQKVITVSDSIERVKIFISYFIFFLEIRIRQIKFEKNRKRGLFLKI